ncbi:MAG: MiaB/RimO family radical SAM methylthiotransferase [bacterium]|nr:MiaB/RimO family radical SAM methylthiotransferase [bacterium]
MPSFSIITLGCRVNQADSDRLRQILLGAGFEEKEPGEQVDCAIVNTCTVTSEADRKSRQMIRRAQKTAAQTVATGCAVADRGGAGKLSSAVLRLKPESRDEILTLLGASGCPGNEPLVQHRTRALLKIQEGCDHFCTYCIVPYVRGRSRTFDISECLAKARELDQAGYKEIVLTGIHLAMWGRDLEPSLDLADFLEKLIHETNSARFRISSIEPMAFPRRIIEMMAKYPQRICPHLHLAMQHASDIVLKRMKRDYTLAEYEDLASEFIERVPGACLTTDVMLGFPGETEDDVAILLDYLSKRLFYHLHVFAYSPRPGTAAAHFADKVPEPVKKERLRRVIEAGKQSERLVLENMRGMVRPVLVEKVSRPGFVTGTADNFITCELPGDESLLGEIVPAPIQLPEA